MVQKYDRELKRLQQFMAGRGQMLIEDIHTEDLTEFKFGWPKLYPSSQTRGMVQTRLKGFLRYCYQARWLDRIPNLTPIKIDRVPTLPLSDAEYERLLKRIPKEFPDSARAKRVGALINLMRWSDLAISDAVTVERNLAR